MQLTVKATLNYDPASQICFSELKTSDLYWLPNSVGKLDRLEQKMGKGPNSRGRFVISGEDSGWVNPNARVIAVSISEVKSE